MLCRSRWLVVPLSIAATGGPTPARAQLAPDLHGVIHVCYGGADGRELHIIGAGAPCPRKTEPLSWNQLGRRGPTGLVGVPSSIFELSVGGGGNGGSGGKGGNGGTGGTGGKGGDGAKSEPWKWIEDAVPALGNALLLVGLGLLAVSIALVPLGSLLGLLLRWRWLWRRRFFRWLPALRIQPFDDSAMSTKLGKAFALLAQARVGGGREGGGHLYLVTGEKPPGPALADIQGVPQTQALGAAISLLRLTWKRRQLIVEGSLMPVEGGEAVAAKGAEDVAAKGGETVAVAVSLRRDSRFVDTAEFWPSQPPADPITATSSNSVLAVAAAGWIEHHAVNQTPGPSAYEVFLSHDARSWALFRAGSELARMSCLRDAADYYEKALAIDEENAGALVDLAHLRRLDSYFEGAHGLARRAVYLIEERNRTCLERDSDDANWYRAHIVLAAVETSWASDLESRNTKDLESRNRNLDRAARLRSAAFERGIRVALDGMDTQDRVVRIVGTERLEHSAQGAQFGLLARWKMRRRASREAGTI